MLTAYCYILFSPSLQKFYTGATTIALHKLYRGVNPYPKHLLSLFFKIRHLLPTMQKVTTWLNKRFPVWEDTFTRKVLLIVFIEMFSIGFKYIYKPFGMELSGEYALSSFIGHGTLNILVLLFQFFLLPKLFNGYFLEKNRTLGREIAWMVVLFFILTIAHASFSFFDGVYLVIPNSLLDSLFVNISIGIFPVVVILLLGYVKQLQDRLKEKEVNTTKYVEKEVQNELVEITSEAGNEKIQLPLRNLIYLKSSDNYTEVYYNEGERINKKMLRTTLGSIENNLKSKYLFRIHRSYIINLLKIDSVTGNSNKCDVILNNVETPIPISRGKRKELLEKLEKLPVTYKL